MAEVISIIMMVIGYVTYALAVLVTGFVAVLSFSLTIAMAIVPSVGHKRFDDEWWFVAKTAAQAIFVAACLLLPIYWLEGGL